MKIVENLCSAIFLLICGEKYSTFAAIPKYVKLGGQFPMFTTTGIVDTSGIQYLAGMMIAINEINNKTDGIADDLLPSTKLRFAFRTPKRSFIVAVQVSLEQATTVFNGTGVTAVIGPVASAASISSTQIFSSYKIFQIAYGAPDSSLSDKTSYPYFSRTYPADSFQGRAMADIVVNTFNWNKVSTFSTSDVYGSAGISEFQTRANALGITVLSTHSFDPNTVDLSSYISSAKTAGAYIFIFFMSSSDATNLLQQGYSSNLFREGTQIIGSDLITVPSTWNNMLSTSEIASIMKGYLGLIPTFSFDSPSGKAFVKKWRSQAPTVTINSDGTKTCNTKKDDDGGFYLYQGHADGKSTSPMTCSGIVFSKFKADGSDISPFTAYAYDTVYYVAKGIHKAIYQHRIHNITGDVIKNILSNELVYNGLTGNISMFPSTDSKHGGDRKTGIVYNIYNFQPSKFTGRKNATGLVVIGKWYSESGTQFCSSSSSGCNPIVYNTADNSKPHDSAVEVIKYPKQTFIDILLIISLFIGVQIIMLGLLFLFFSKSQVIRVSGSMYLWGILTAAILGGIRVGFYTKTITAGSCTTQQWIIHAAVILLLVTTINKCWILNKIFNSGFKRISASIKKSYINVLIALSVFCIFLFIVVYLGQPHASTRRYNNGDRILVYSICTTSVPSLAIILYIIELSLILFNARLCWLIRKIPKCVNESKNIGLVLLLLVASAFIGNSLSSYSLYPTESQFSHSLLTAVVVILSLLLLLWTKIYQLVKGVSFESVALISISASSHGGPEMGTRIITNEVAANLLTSGDGPEIIRVGNEQIAEWNRILRAMKTKDDAGRSGACSNRSDMVSKESRFSKLSRFSKGTPSEAECGDEKKLPCSEETVVTKRSAVSDFSTSLHIFHNQVTSIISSGKYTNPSRPISEAGGARSAGASAVDTGVVNTNAPIASTNPTASSFLTFNNLKLHKSNSIEKSGTSNNNNNNHRHISKEHHHHTPPKGMAKIYAPSPDASFPENDIESSMYFVTNAEHPVKLAEEPPSTIPRKRSSLLDFI